MSLIDKYVFPLVAISALYFGTGLYNPVALEAQGKPKVSVQKSVEEITNSEIEKLMQKKSVEEILEGCNIKYATYIGNGRTNLWEMIFKDGRSAVVLLYSNTGVLSGEPSKRDAIILKKLTEKYDQIAFFLYNADELGGKTKSTKFDGLGNNLFGKSDYGIPSFSMISKYDVVKGETPEKNDGKLKVIDIARGGPSVNSDINGRIINLSNYWINTNLLLKSNPEGERKVSRLENSFQEWKKYHF
jgi:hypothetical protein